MVQGYFVKRAKGWLNFSRVVCLAAAIGLLGLAGAYAEVGAREDTVTPPKGFREVGGSNYVMCHVGKEYREQHLEDSWTKPDVLHPVIGTLHLHKQAEILDQLKVMHDGGQRKIALVVWFDHFTVETDYRGVFGHVVRSNGGSLLPQHQANLHTLLKMIRSTGYFNELNFRFATQGAADPGEWARWDEAMYQENWSFIVNTRRIVEEDMRGGQVKVIYDLGLELGGFDTAQYRPYTKRLWQDYCATFGKADTYGFSFALSPGLVTKMLKVYDEAGTRPELFAFDIYTHPYETLEAAAKEFKEAGLSSPKVIIQETYYNDPQTLQQFQRAQQDFKLDFLYLMQWPLDRGAQVPHLSMDFPAQYGAYVQRKAGA